MERKIIKQGGGGFTVYLPKKWVIDNRISKGDEIDINISGNDLILSLKPTKKKNKIEITLSNLKESLIRTLITNCYRNGYDIVNVNFSNETQYQILQEVVRTKLMGFEIIKRDKNSCIIESVSEPSYDQFDNLLKKLFLNIDDLFTITRFKLGLNSLTETEDINDVEDRIQRYDNFCKRVIMKQKLIKSRSEQFWSFLTILIHSQREIYILNNYIDKNFKITKEIKELFDVSYNLFKLIEKVYFTKDFTLIGEIHQIEKDHNYKKSYKKLINSKNDVIITHHLIRSIRSFYLVNSSLCGLIL